MNRYDAMEFENRMEARSSISYMEVHIVNRSCLSIVVVVCEINHCIVVIYIFVV